VNSVPGGCSKEMFRHVDCLNIGHAIVSLKIRDYVQVGPDRPMGV
jgi:hypothetical protein